MQKPLDLARQGFAVKNFESIIQQTSATKQLTHFISCQSLTDCLTILENLGYTGDLAVFILANLQSLEAAR